MIKLKNTSICILAFLGLVLFPSLAFSAPINRTILAIFDSSEDYNRRDDRNMIHDNAEMVLNYLGLRVIYHDIQEEGLPSAEKMKNVRGILTWFLDEQMRNAQAYAQWAEEQLNQGKYYVALGNLGFLKDSGTQDITPLIKVNEVMNPIGLIYHGHRTDDPFEIELVKKVPEMVEFERTLDNEIGLYELMRPLDPEAKTYLMLRKKNEPGSESSVVVTTKQGGFALRDYEAIINYFDDGVRWRINPFSFFSEAFHVQTMPKYDVTTLFGKRIFYSHIDGDGFRNISDLDHKSYSGEIIYDQIIKTYNVPITVSFITADVDPKYFGSDELVDLAKKILDADNVEIGVHAFTHPLDWKRQVTVYAINKYSKTLDERLLNEMSLPANYSYTSGALITVNKEEYLNAEIKKAVDFTNETLAPKNKRVELYQWSGNCEPSPEAIDLTRSLKVKNINRGDSRFDRYLPSYTGVAALTRQPESRLQVQTSNSNENIYTDGWEVPYDRYEQVIETFQQTEYPTLVDGVPRRVAAINVYYHFYSGEKVLALEALKKAYTFALQQDIIPIFTSRYVKIVEGFVSGEMSQNEQGGYEFKEYGMCQTVRFDGTQQVPDMQKSKGIYGYSFWEGYLYVYLTEIGDATLYLTSTSNKNPYMEYASTIIKTLSINKDSLAFTTQLWAGARYQFANMEPNTTYRIKADTIGKNETVVDELAKTDSTGQLFFKLEASGRVSVSVTKEA